MTITFRFEADVWEYPGEAAWFFATLPVDVADELAVVVPERRGFGSIRVTATIGTTTWNTSIFPSREAESFLLPLKRDVRRRERLEVGSRPAITLDIEPD